MKKKLIYLLFVSLVICSVLPGASVVLASPETETLRPNAAGDEENCSGAVGGGVGTHYTTVDEAVADGDTSYVYNTSSSYERDLYNLPASSGVGIINKITVYARMKYTTLNGSKDAKISIKSGTTTEDSAAKGITASWSNYSQEWALNPDDGEAWEWADIDNLQIGFSLDGQLGLAWACCTQVYVEVDYTPTAPSITTQAATNIATTTARLNSSLISDGGESCNVSFQYHAGSENWTACENTSWVSGYTTGQFPFADISSLDWNTEYFFRARAKNTIGTTNGTALSFTTGSGLSAPTDFKSFPLATSVTLSWTKGAGSTNTLVRYKEGSYSANTTDGFLVYNGVLNSCSHTGLPSGTTIYYSAWGISGENVSSTYVMVMATTLPVVTAAGTPDAPTQPSTWFSTPDYTKFSNLLAVYDLMNKFADSLGMPRNNFWMISSLFGCTLLGIIIGTWSKNAVPALIALAVSVGISSLIGLLPMWMMVFTVLFIIGAVQFGRAGRTM